MIAHRSVSVLLAGAMLACGPGAGEPPVSPRLQWDGEVAVHGSLREILHQGRVAPVTTLDGLLPSPHLYAVGALGDLAGEVTVVSGTAFFAVPRPGGVAQTFSTLRSDAGVSLLVASEVPRWREIVTEAPLTYERLDEGLGRLARRAEMDLASRFPVLIQGEVEDLRWHVVDGSRLPAGPATHQAHREVSVNAARDRVFATLVGFYSARDEGVFTHMGSRTHLHCVVDEPLASGHVDHVILPAGTRVRFPLR